MSRRRLLNAILALILLAASVTIGVRQARLRPIYLKNLRFDGRMGRMEPPRLGQKILIFAPHEDDEILGCAGFIQRAVKASAQVHIVFMTNGEYPEIDVILFEEKLIKKTQAYIDLGYRRQQESLKALRSIGIPGSRVTFLGYPNQYLNQMWSPAHWLPENAVTSIRTGTNYSPYSDSATPHAMYCGSMALADVEKELLRIRPDMVITLHPSDVHVDHWPTYAFARYALSELADRGETFAQGCHLYTFLIHRDGWPAPHGYHPQSTLRPPSSLAAGWDTAWVTFPLSHEEEMRKRAAISMFRTQAGPIDPLLRSFIRRNELFGVVMQHSWNPATERFPSVELRDPEADLVASEAHPHEDICSASMRVDGSRLVMTVVTRGTAAPGTRYHFSIHTGKQVTKDRIFAECDWKGTKGSGVLLRNGTRRGLAAGFVTTLRRGNESIATVRSPFVGAQPDFVMVRASITRGMRTIDQTSVDLYRAESPGPSQ